MNNAELAVKLLALANKAFTSIERTNAAVLYDDLEKFFLTNQSANMDVLGNKLVAGSSTTLGVFKSTPAVVCRDLASILYSTMSPPTKRWSKFRHRDKMLNNNSNVSKWLDEVNEIIHREFSDSNFYKCLGSSYLVFCGLGTMAILHEQKEAKADGTYGGVRFTNLHPGQIAWAENADGIVDSLYRKCQMTARQVIDRWGSDEDSSIPERILKMGEECPDDEVIIIHCIYPRPSKEVKISSIGVTPSENRPYASYFIDEESATILEEEGHYEFPCMVCRFETMPGEVIGRGPGHVGLPDAKSLNRTIKDTFLASAKAINPSIISTARNIMSNAVDLTPGGVTYVRNLDQFKEFGTQARFDVAQVQAEKLQDDLAKIFMLDKLLLPPRQDTGEMSAFEIARRIEEAQRVLGSVPSRIESELLKPTIIRQFRIMLRAGALPPTPEELKNSDLDIDIELVSQLARAQTIEEVSAIQQSAQHIMMLAQMNPEVIDNMDTDEAARIGMRILGAPESVIAGDVAIKQIRDSRTKAQQQQAQEESQLRQADAASKMAKVGGGQ